MNRIGHTQVRQSNIELLRIVAMFLVLIVHADFFALGEPAASDIRAGMVSSGTRFLIQALSVVCVDCYVLISGWFGIRFNLKSLSNFLFQGLFFAVGIYGACLLAGISDISMKGIAGCFFLTERSYWFIKAYVGLYILTPVLNVFIEHAGKSGLLGTVLSFYIFQTLYGWLSNGAPFFESGYSTLSFVGLYLLARYMRLYGDFSGGGNPVSRDLYGDCNCHGVGFAFCRFARDRRSDEPDLFIHRPACNRCGSLPAADFSKLTIQNKIINWIGISCFSVYLLHANSNLFTQYFKPSVIRIYEATGGIASLAAIFLFLAAIFVTAILLDKIRIFLWEKFFVSLFDRM